MSMITKTKLERFQHRRLFNYFREWYEDLEDEGEIEFYNDPAPNQWLFDIPELNVRVKLTCDKDGNVFEEVYNLTTLKRDRTVREIIKGRMERE